MSDQSFIEELIKSCPRCGGSSANKGNPSGRCSSCLKKLKTAKHTPGTYQRAHMKADDALRRQSGKKNGKNVTAPGTSKGHGTRKEIVDKMKSSEKKTGQKLSPDRRDNKRGYESKNVRAIPEKLNVGRHKADEGKIAAWKKRLKKTGVSMEEFTVLLKAKFASPAEQKANRTKATTSANKDAMSYIAKPKATTQKDTFKYVIDSTSPTMHAVQAANYAPGTPANKAHAALAYHHSGVKPLSEIEVRGHKKMLTDHYNSGDASIPR